MNTLPSFELRRPASLPEACALLAAEPGARAIAGGTDVLPNLRHGIGASAVLVDLSAVRGLDEFSFGDNASLNLGAGVTLARLAADARIARDWPALAQAAAAVAGPGHRSVATLGGNLCLDTRCVYYNQSAWWRAANAHCLKLGGDSCHVAPQGSRCHAAFAGDLAPALLVLGAELDVVAQHGSRRIALAELYRDDGAAHLTLARGELIAGVHLPAAGARSGYRKARVRGAMDFPLAGVACALTMSGGALSSLRLAVTGTNSSPLLIAGTDELLGQPLGEEALARLAKLVQKQVSPMRSTATPANYRRLVASALAQRLVRELAAAETP